MTKKNQLHLLSFCTLYLLAACGGEQAPPASTEPALDDDQNSIAGPPRTASPPGARVFFITPSNGDTVSTTFAIEFGVEGMTIVPAGNNSPNSGHHHLLIDTDLPDLNLPVPADANHVHFGDGSTSTERTLPPGTHTLQLLLGDHLHIPHQPPVYSELITITVE